MSDIFISYASPDRPRIKALVDALEQRGWSVWWDHHISQGKPWDDILGAELAAARCVLVLWSLQSVNSEWVKTEAHEGMNRKILVPALLDDVEIPFGFGRIQVVSLVHWSGASSSAEFEKLASGISAVLSLSPLPIFSPTSARDRAAKILETVVRRRTRGLLAIVAALTIVIGLMIGYILTIRPLQETSSKIGLKRIELGKYSTDENARMGDMIRGAHTLRLLLPNASNFAQSFKDDFEEFFQKPDSSMQVIFATPNSDFYKEMTQMTLGTKWQEKDYETNRGLVNTSRQRLLSAAKGDESKVAFRYFDTQFRVPLIIIDNRYCFLTIRLPPHEGEESPRLEFDGGYAQTCINHFNEVWQFSSSEPLPTNH
jgi:hypothetical protein